MTKRHFGLEERKMECERQARSGAMMETISDSAEPGNLGFVVAVVVISVAWISLLVWACLAFLR